MHLLENKNVLQHDMYSVLANILSQKKKKITTKYMKERIAVMETQLGTTECQMICKYDGIMGVFRTG